MSLWPTITYDATGLHAWAENLSATGRRQATSVAASKLRQWVNRTLEERPSRGELRAWVELVLDDRRALHNKAEALTKENEALTAQRDDALEEAARLRRARDEALESYREDVEHFRVHVETLAADRTRRTRERDDAQERVVAVVKAYEELRVAYEQAEGERNELAREQRNPSADARELRRLASAGRAECSHTPGGGAK